MISPDERHMTVPRVKKAAMTITGHNQFAWVQV